MHVEPDLKTYAPAKPTNFCELFELGKVGSIQLGHPNIKIHQDKS